MKCKECNNTGLTMIDVDAPFGNGKIEGYCDCKAGSDLAMTELCFDCGCHKNETNEKLLYKKFRHGCWIYLCKNCLKETLYPQYEINKLMARGHPYHCACRMTWGDGERECGNVFWHTTTGKELPIH